MTPAEITSNWSSYCKRLLSSHIPQPTIYLVISNGTKRGEKSHEMTTVTFSLPSNDILSCCLFFNFRDWVKSDRSEVSKILCHGSLARSHLCLGILTFFNLVSLSVTELLGIPMMSPRQ